MKQLCLYLEVFVRNLTGRRHLVFARSYPYPTLFAIYLIDYILLEVFKLIKSLQTENLDLSIISSLVDPTLHTLEDVLQPAAKWVLDFQEVKEMYTNAGISSNSDDVAVFQGRVKEPFTPN